MNSLNLFTLSMLHCDTPEPWQIGFQDGASPAFEGMTELHDAIFFYLIVIGVGVGWFIGSVVLTFGEARSPLTHKYYNHGTLVELIWTVTPALVLVAIAFPSFKLLYLMDVINTTKFVNITMMAGVPMRALYSNCTAIVPYGNVGMTLNMSFTRQVRELVHFPVAIISQIVGHLLGDGHLSISSTSVTPCFIFVQTIAKFSYAWHVFTVLAHYCNKLPRLNLSVRAGTPIASLAVITRSYPTLLYIYPFFYSVVNGVNVKSISVDILPYLTPLALAVWIIDDGAASTKGRTLYIHTKGFTFADVYLLAAMLHYNFGLVVNVQRHKDRPVIYVPAASMPLLRYIVQPHMHPSILYKLP